MLALDHVNWIPSPWGWYAGGACLLGVFLVVVGLVRRRRQARPRCPRCRYDMREAPLLRCPECGHVARDARDLRRTRGNAWLVAAGVLAIVAVPGYRGYEWSRSRAFTPPLGYWRELARLDLGDGVVVEVLEPRDPAEMWDAVRISRNGAVEQMREDFSIDVLDPARQPRAPFRAGTDITGNGLPNIVIELYSGGAHCCSTYAVYEYGPEIPVHRIASIEAAHGGHFEDRDGDGVFEFVTADWSWAYALSCFTCVRAPTVVLRYDGDGYALALDLMRAEPPGEADWASLLAEVAALPEEQRAVDLIWTTMLRLVYTGHIDLAERFFDEAWPPGAEGKLERLGQFRKVLTTVPRWNELREWADGDVVSGLWIEREEE